MIKYADAIRRAKEGNEEAFTFLYEQTYKKSYYVALKYMKNETLAEDVLQESYVVAFKSLNQLDDPEKFPAWLGRIVATRSLNELKKKQPLLFSQTENEEGQDISATFEDDRVSGQPELSMDQQETKRLMQEIIGALSEEQRVCITMFYMEEMSVKEMAEILQVSENTVKSRLNYGRQKIKDKVLDLEKKGTKLYGLAPIPFFLLLCKEEASAATYTIPALSFSTCAQAATAGKTALGGAVAAGAKGLTMKIVAGVVAGTLLVGGGAAAIVNSQKIAAMVRELPEWARFPEDTRGKYISIEGYKYPIELKVCVSGDDEYESGSVTFLTNHGGFGYGGEQSPEKKGWYFGECNGNIYYCCNIQGQNGLYSLYLVPDSDLYNQMLENDELLNTFLYEVSDSESLGTIENMINMPGYSFEEWYYISEDDLFDTAEEAYADWLIHGEEEMEKIYASHITLWESDSALEQEPEVETTVVEEVASQIEEEAESQTEEEPEIPIPTSNSTNYWNTSGRYVSASGKEISVSMFTSSEDDSNWSGNIRGDELPETYELFFEQTYVYSLKKASNKYTSFEDTGYVITFEASGETEDRYGYIYDKLLIKIYLNGVLQDSYYQTEMYES